MERFAGAGRPDPGMKLLQHDLGSPRLVPCLVAVMDHLCNIAMQTAHSQSCNMQRLSIRPSYHPKVPRQSVGVHAGRKNSSHQVPDHFYELSVSAISMSIQQDKPHS